MSVTTHDPNIVVNIYLDPRATQVADFGADLHLVDRATNSLNGVRVATFTRYEDAVTAQTAGYISATTLLAAAAAFAQRPSPTRWKVGYVDLAAAVVAVKAFKTFGGALLGDGYDAKLEAHVAGVAGNKIAFELVGDSAGAVTTTVTVVGDYTYVTAHYQPGVSTVTNVNTAITALAGAEDVIDVNTAGTGATVLDADAGEMSPVFLAGGVDAVANDTYPTALAAAIAYDPDFYLVTMDSRSQAIQVALSDAIEAIAKPMLFALQDDDTSWLDSGVPAGVTGMVGNERTVGYWHTTDSVWSDVASAVNRIAYNPDTKSVPWNGYSVRGIDAHSTPPTAAQRLFLIANYMNVGLPFGGQDFVIDPGVNFNGRPVYEIVTSDWFKVRVSERIAALQVQHGDRGEKLLVDRTGQKKIKAIIEGLLKQGDAVGHFIPPGDDDTPRVVAETITDADRASRTLRFTVRAQIGVSVRLFTLNCYFSRDPIADNG